MLSSCRGHKFVLYQRVVASVSIDLRRLTRPPNNPPVCPRTIDM